MRKIVEAKLAEAEAQQAEWQQALLVAQEQLARWNGVIFACREMLDSDREQSERMAADGMGEI